jgi:hypothetical protein
MSIEAFEAIMARILGPRDEGSALPIFDPGPWLGSAGGGSTGTAVAGHDDGWTPGATATASLTAAFLVALSDRAEPAFERAIALLDDPPVDAPPGLADLYRRGVALVRDEVARVTERDPAVAARMRSAAERIGSLAGGAADGGPALDEPDTSEILWSVFFPEGVGIRGHESGRESSLRATRTVTIATPNPLPILDPARELLFTSNVLLTTPSPSRPIEELPYPPDLLHELARAAAQPQAHWYDHPIQIGVEPASNELLYGLRGLDEAIEFERRRTSGAGRVTCVLSVSVTHPGLHAIARRYVEAELATSEPLRHLDVLVFTEDDTDRLVDEVLVPGVDRFLELEAADASSVASLLRQVLGVDGAYGRHYSFLKAIAALWHVLLDPQVRGTFKIDLDQVFPQEVLVAETGQTAFEHLGTSLWGARGFDSRGREVELGMLAGALVNERDIGRGLFTPDVGYPDRPLAADQYVFFSGLPQALSTRAEMMERYDAPERDGSSACLERVHVTGGTNGILVDALRRHRPFTPSFIGRAEDQAYLLSVLRRWDEGTDGARPRLAYAHAAGLIMRHDKEAFAGEAMAAAEAGKLIGDDVRILQFSAYARVVAGSIAAGRADPAAAVAAVKAILDPFTGCFVSRLPATVAMLRFALRVARVLQEGRADLGLEIAEIGARRLDEALTFTRGEGFEQQISRERAAWDRYYDVLDALEGALRTSDPVALDLQRRAREIIGGALVRVG